MGWRSWNKADKTLLAAAVIFLFALCVHLQYRDRVVANGFLFCAEAALVGGIADWFAVTALFRKPLGFPWHTAILPHRRQAFIDSSVDMVQQEFFSRKKLFARIRNLDLLSLLLGWLGKAETQQMLSGWLWHYVRSWLLRMDQKKQATVLAAQLRKAMLDIEPQRVFQKGSQWLQMDGHDQKLLGHIASYLKEKAAEPAMRRTIEGLLEEYQKQRTTGTLASFFAGLAHAMNLVNFEEAAALMQEQLLAMLTELGKPGSVLQQELLALFYEKADQAAKAEDFLRFFTQLREEILQGLPMEAAMEACLDYARTAFLAEEKSQDIPELRSRLMHIFDTELKRCLVLLQEHSGLQREIDGFLYDMVARTALAAQGMVGVIVRNVLGRLTDEQLNHLVYDKVEPDLLWIRMNGSIVGSGIGLCLFLLLQVFAK